ncbi:hypothetical protein [Methylobacterium sp. 88A]|uniref:hypothetical protein n=1 Tax=Methylobacterium sp. 88A TaxID=1131813 RepID=UPI0003680D6B|nr:hypothetical protein [Methylobacterium sp. 88A]
MSNRDRLVSLMERLALTKGDVARIARASETSVDSWLKPETSKSHRACPNVVIAVIEYGAGDTICASVSEAADHLGLRAERVNTMAADARVGLGAALWSAGMDDTLARVSWGHPVTLDLGPASYLLLKGWVFLPLQGRDGRRCKLAVRASVEGEEGSDGRWLNTEVNDWVDDAEARKAAAQATHIAGLMEQNRMLGLRRVEALDAGDEAEVRRIDKVLDIVGQQIDAA